MTALTIFPLSGAARANRDRHSRPGKDQLHADRALHQTLRHARDLPRSGQQAAACAADLQHAGVPKR